MNRNNMKEYNLPSNKSFGIVFFLLFLILAVFFYVKSSSAILILIFLLFSVFFLISGLLQSKILTPLNKIWFKFGILLGKIISPIIMGIIFFFVVTPISFLMKLLKKDILNLKFNNNNSYWIDKTGPKSKMKNQF